MKFNRERGIRRETPKQDVLALEPAAYLQTSYEITGRKFYICLGKRTLARGLSANKAWGLAKKILEREKT